MLRLSCFMLVVSLFAAAPAFADPTLNGPEAFGGWKQDKPGLIRHITPRDLPPPNTEKPASNYSKHVDLPQDANLNLLPGFEAQMIASGIKNPRALRFAPNGDLFVADSMANQVRIYRFKDGYAKPSENGVFADTSLDRPYGIAFYPPGNDPQWVYIANSDSVMRLPYNSGDMKAGGAPEKIIDKIPATHHWTRDIAFSPDGKTLFLTVGSGSNVALDMADTPTSEGESKSWAENHALGAAWDTEDGRANLLTFDPDGKNRKVYATGLRNCAGLTIQPQTSEPWCVVNERDGLGDNTPFEYATHVQQGAFYGWPWYYIGDHQDNRPPSKQPDLKGKVTVGDVMMQAHSAPLGIAFYDGKLFPPEYVGDAFVTMHGSWNRGERTGYKVVRLLFKDGKATGAYQDFITGFVKSDDEIWGRPVGVAVAPDGSLFISEDGSGTIWRISYKG